MYFVISMQCNARNARNPALLGALVCKIHFLDLKDLLKDSVLTVLSLLFYCKVFFL